MPEVSENSDVRIQRPPDAPDAPSESTGKPVGRAAEAQQTQAPLPPPTALRGRGDRPQETRDTDAVLDALGREKPISESEAASALEWFLSEDPEEETHNIELNVGLGDKERWITWTVRPIDTDELRRIQRTTAALRRRNKQDDVGVDQLGNVKIVIAGSVEPDIEAIAEARGVSPESLLQKRFRMKPGLITQLSAQIMALSGFDDDDVRDALSAKN